MVPEQLSSLSGHGGLVSHTRLRHWWGSETLTGLVLLFFFFSHLQFIMFNSQMLETNQKGKLSSFEPIKVSLK